MTSQKERSSGKSKEHGPQDQRFSPGFWEWARELRNLKEQAEARTKDSPPQSQPPRRYKGPVKPENLDR